MYEEMMRRVARTVERKRRRRRVVTVPFTGMPGWRCFSVWRIRLMKRIRARAPRMSEIQRIGRVRKRMYPDAPQVLGPQEPTVAGKKVRRVKVALVKARVVRRKVRRKVRRTLGWVRGVKCVGWNKWCEEEEESRGEEGEDVTYCLSAGMLCVGSDGSVKVGQMVVGEDGSGGEVGTGGTV